MNASLFSSFSSYLEKKGIRSLLIRYYMKKVHRGGTDYIHIWNLIAIFHQENIYTEIF